MSRHSRAKKNLSLPIYLVVLGFIASSLVYAAGFLPTQPFKGILNLVGLAQVGSVGTTRAASLNLKLPTAGREYLIGYPLKVQWVKSNVPAAWVGKVTLSDAAGVTIYDSSNSAQVVSSTNNSYIFTIPNTPNLGTSNLTVQFTDAASAQSVSAKQTLKLLNNPNVLLKANFNNTSLAADLNWETVNVPKHWLGKVSVYGPGIFNRVVKDKLPVSNQAGTFTYPLDYMAAGNYQFTLEFYDPAKTQTGTVKITGSVYKPE